MIETLFNDKVSNFNITLCSELFMNTLLYVIGVYSSVKGDRFGF